MENFHPKDDAPAALYEGVKDLEADLARYETGLAFVDVAAKTASPDVKALFAGLSQDKDGDGRPDGLIPEVVYRAAIDEHRPVLQAIYANAFKQHDLDALIFPTTPLPAAPIEGNMETVSLNGEAVPTFTTFIRNTDPGSNAGLPGLSLPIGLTKGGLPVGIELDGPVGSDADILAIGLALETILLPNPTTPE